MKLIFIHGPVASGKLTVARELAALTGLAVFHNHLVVDAVASVFPFGSEPFIRLREQFWLTMFREAAKAQRSLIFTFAPEPTVSSDFPAHVQEIITAAGGELFFVRLTVDTDEQEERIANASRKEFGKLRSLDLLRALRSQSRACEALMPAADVVIDTRIVTSVEAAHKIAQQLDLI